VTPVKPDTSTFSSDKRSIGNGFASDFHRDTFYVWQIAPEVAQGDVARSAFYGGG
jgi:hypothetical protein